MQLDIDKVCILIHANVEVLITPLIIMRNFLERCNQRNYDLHRCKLESFFEIPDPEDYAFKAVFKIGK